VYTSSSKA